MSGKQVMFGLRIPDTLTKQIGFVSTHKAKYTWLDTTQIRSVNTNCQPYLKVITNNFHANSTQETHFYTITGTCTFTLLLPAQTSPSSYL